MQNQSQLSSVNIRRILTVFTCVLAAGIQIIDGTIVNVAIPTIMGNLGVDLDNITWITSSYLIAHVVILPIIGWLSHRVGRKKYLLYCILVFSLSSVGAGLSNGLWMIVFFRVIQGFAGGALMPIALSFIYEAFPKDQSAKASAIFGGCVMIAPAIGPLMGGYITDYFGWRYIFFVNLPIGLIAIFTGLLGIKDEEGQSAGKIDFLGILFLFLGVGFFQFAIERGETLGWWTSNWIAFSFAMAFVFIPAFIFRCLNAKNPLLDLTLLKQFRISLSCILSILFGYILYGISFLIPIYANQVWGLDAIQTGWIFVPGALIVSALMPLVARLTKYFSPSLIVSFGLLCVGVSLYLFGGLNNISSYYDMYLPTIIVRFGFAVGFVPIVMIAMEGFEGKKSTEVSSLINFARQFGGSVSFAILATMLSNFQKKYYEILRWQINPLRTPVQEFERQLGANFARDLPEEIGDGSITQAVGKILQEKVELQTFVLSYDRIMWITMFIVLASILPLILIPKKVK